MSPERKVLKIACFALFVVAVACIVTGAVILVNGDLAVSQPLGTAGAALCVVAGILGIALCASGIRGANTPRQAGGVRPVGVAEAVAAAAASGCVVAGAPAPLVVAPALALVLAVVCLVYAGKVFEQAQR